MYKRSISLNIFVNALDFAEPNDILSWKISRIRTKYFVLSNPASGLADTNSKDEIGFLSRFFS